jgi:hypothetical protein
MNKGYVKLWRKTIDAGWLRNHKLFCFWSWCLMKATYKEHDFVVGCQQVHLMPGEFVFGRKVAALELNMSEQEIRTAVDSMRKRKNLTIKSTNKFSIISITNWDTYQSQEDRINQQINQQLTINQPTTNHKQEGNKGKNTYSDDFNSFWNTYPKKIGKDAAWKAWVKRNGSLPEINIILTALEAQKKADAWTKDKGQFIPNPATWINQGRWMDEVKVEKAGW